MKGPGLRLDLDVRRIWRCTKCGKVVRTPGQVTAQRCGCTEPAQWMHLVPAVKKEPFRAPIREHLPEAWELEESGAANSQQPTVTTASGKSEQPAVTNTPEPADLPGDGSPTVVVTEVIATELIVETVSEGPAPTPTNPPPDEFGTGVDAPPRNPDPT